MDRSAISKMEDEFVKKSEADIFTNSRRFRPADLQRLETAEQDGAKKNDAPPHP